MTMDRQEPPTVGIVNHLINEIDRLHGPIQLGFDTEGCMALIAQLQLALRHPNNRGTTASWTRSFIEDLIDTIGQRSPALAAFLRLGNDPSCDVEWNAAESQARRSNQQKGGGS